MKKINISRCEKIIKKVDNAKGNIIYVHGFTGNFTNKTFLMNYYNEYNFYAINLPGHGNSKYDDDKEIDFMYFVEIIKTFISELSLNEFILMGHSMGGALAMVVSQYFKKKIKLIILESPANITIMDNWDVIKLLIPKDIVETEIIYNKLIYKMDSLFRNETDKERFLKKEYAFAITNSHLTKMLEKSKINEWMNLNTNSLKDNNIKTLILLGKYDGIVITEETINFINQLGKSNYEIFVINNSAHLPIYENRVEAFSILDKFIKTN